MQQLDIPYAGVIVHHDQDAVFTGYGWARQLVLEDSVRLSFTLRGFKDNPEMESFNGRFKEENYSLFLETQTQDELIEVVNERMRYYNEERRHSSIGYLPPLAFIKRVSTGLACGKHGQLSADSELPTLPTGPTTTTASFPHSDHTPRGSQ